MGEEQGAESSNPLIIWLIPLATGPHPKGLPKSHLINLNSVWLKGLVITRVT